MANAVFFVSAAVAEIAGCYFFWMWLKLGRSVVWVLPGILSLAVFAALLARTDAALAGRAFAAYGGVYIAASLVWLALEEQTMPGPWDFAGAILCIAGACIIVAGPEFS